MGDSSPGGNAATYSKRHETADSNLFADSSASPNGSWNEAEKFGAAAAVGAGAGGAYGAMSQARDNDPWAVQQQQQQQAPQHQQQPHDSWAAPSFNSSAPQSQYGQQQAYPPQNVPGSSVNLLSNGSSAPLALGAALPAGASPFADPSHQSIEQREMQQEMENRRLSMAAKAAGGAGVAGVGAAAAVLAASSPFGESEGQGEIRVVKGTFDPSLEDELVLQVRFLRFRLFPSPILTLLRLFPSPVLTFLRLS
jgi:hypothetical protein